MTLLEKMDQLHESVKALIAENARLKLRIQELESDIESRDEYLRYADAGEDT